MQANLVRPPGGEFVDQPLSSLGESDHWCAVKLITTIKREAMNAVEVQTRQRLWFSLSRPVASRWSTTIYMEG